jgi:prepilin-type N-terminal cleavage/methylation domain-containing protein
MNTRAKHGFTLIELMIAIALMMILMLMLHSMFVNAQALYTTAAQRVSVYSQARSALDLMEQDLLRMRTIGETDSIHLRSVRPSDFANPDSVRSEGIYTAMDDWLEADSNATPQIREFLSFTGVNTWWDSNRNEYVTGPAMVIYYLRLRPDADQGAEGAYLVRRLLQHRSLAELARIGMGAVPEPLVINEDEIANFVYSVRSYTDDQAAFQLGTIFRDFRHDILPEASADNPNSDWLWLREPGLGGPAPGQQQTPQAGQQASPSQAVLLLPQPPSISRVEFGGTWRTATAMDRDFLSIRWNYPAVVMFELTMIDRTFIRDDTVRGSGTYRTFSRAVYLPATGPMFNLDERDMELLRGR